MEPGEFRVAVGRSSQDLPLETVITLTGDVRVYPKRETFFSTSTVSYIFEKQEGAGSAGAFAVWPLFDNSVEAAYN